MACSDRTRGNIFKLKWDGVRLDIRNKCFFNEGDLTLEQVVQSCECHITGSVHNEAGWALSNLVQ